MTHQENTPVLPTSRKLFRVVAPFVLTLALMVLFLAIPVAVRTANLQNDAVLSWLPSSFGADVVHAQGGYTLTKKALADPVSFGSATTHVDQGGTITYQLTFTNDTVNPIVGAGPGSGQFNIRDLWPNDVDSCLSVSLPPSPPGFTNNEGNCIFGTDQYADWILQNGQVIPAGDAVTFTWAVQIDTPLPNGHLIENDDYFARFDSLVAVSGTTQSMIVNAPELVITKTVSPSPTVLVGDDLVYTIVVENVGNLDSTDVNITDTVPGGATASPVVVSDGGSEAGGVVSWPSFSLATGATATRVFTLTVDDPSLIPGDFIVNDDYVAYGSDIHPNSWATGEPVTVTVDSAITLTVDKVDDPDPVTLAQAGSPLTYTIYITNGPGSTSGVTGVLINDTVPAETTLDSVSVTSGTYSINGNSFVITSTLIPAGGVMTATVNVTVNAPLPDGTIITNTGSVTLPNSSNTTVVGTLEEPTTINSPVDIELAKTVTPNFASPGDLLTYTITITNSGATTGTVSLSDFLNNVFYPNDPLANLQDIVLGSGDVTTVNFNAIVGSVDATTAILGPDFDTIFWNDTAWDVSSSGGTSATTTGSPADLTYTNSGPGYDASSCTIVTLATDYSFTAGNGAQGFVEVRPSGGVWTTVHTLSEDHGAITTVLDVSEYLAGASGAFVRYRFVDPTGPTGSWTVTGSRFECRSAAAVDTTIYTQNVYTNAVVTATYTSLGGPASTVLTDTAPVTITAPSITMTKSATWTPDQGGAALIDAPGATVTYTYDITNTGTEALTVTSLVDDRLGSIAGLPVVLPPFGGTTQISAVTTTIDAIDSDGTPLVVTNTAVVTGTTDTAATVSASASAAVPLTYTAAISIEKTQTTYTVASPASKNDVVVFDITITNPSPLDIDVTGLVDTLTDGIANYPLTVVPAVTTVAANDSVTATASVTITQAMIDNGLAGGLLTNTITITGDDELGFNVDLTDTDIATVPITASIEIEVEKIAEYPGAAASIGDTITYTYRVTNTGSVPIDTLTALDDVEGTIIFSVPPLLAVDAITEVSVTRVVDQADMETYYPEIINTVVVSATSPSLSGTYTDTASATVPLTYTTGISIAKSYVASNGTPAGSGDTITYTFTITNSGELTYTSGTLDDIFTGTSSRGTTSISNALTLPPGVTVLTDVITLSATDISQGLLGDGNLNNRADILAEITSLGVSDSDSDTAAVPLAAQISLSMTKTASPDTNVRPGDTVVYTYVLENDSGVAQLLPNNWLVDSNLTVSPPLVTGGSLNPGDIRTVVRSKVITYSDLTPALTLTNVATATAQPYFGVPVVTTATETINLTYTNEITIVKAVNVVSATVGDVVTYTYTVTTGDAPVDVDIVDDKAGTVATGVAMAAGETRVFTAPYTVVAGDYPSLTNIVVVTGTDTLVNPGDVATDTDTVTIPVQVGGFTVLKTVSDPTPSFGDTITYTYTVTNDTGLDLSLDMFDDHPRPGFGNIATGVAVAAGDTYVLELTYVVTTTDLPGITNTVFATGTSTTPVLTFPGQSTAAFTVAFTPTVDIDKITFVDPVSQTAAVGDVVSYQFVVANTSAVPITVTVTDPQLGALFGPTVLSVAPDSGSSFTFPGPPLNSVEKTMANGDFTFDPGSGQYVYTNTAFANSFAYGFFGVDSDVYTVTLDTNQDIVVTKTVDTDPAGNGDTINYTFEVENAGGIDFDDVTLVDPLVQPAPISLGALAAGTSTSTSLPYSVTIADADAGTLTNTVTVTGTTPFSGVTATATDTLAITTYRILTDVVITKDLPDNAGDAGVTQNFTATVSPANPPANTGVVSYTWSFGDGNSSGPSISPNANNIYASPGVYTVVVTAANAVSLVTDTYVITITDEPIVIDEFLNNSPKIVLPAPSLGATVDFTVTLTSGSNVSYQFDWADGNISPVVTSTTRSHDYVTPGVYIVSVEATNTAGTASATTTVIITSLELDKDAVPAPGTVVGPTSLITYSIAITNRPNNGGTVGPITVTDQLPADVTFLGLSSVPPGATLIGGPDVNNVITVGLASVAADSVRTIYVSTQVTDTVTSGQVLTNTASGTSDQVNRTDTNNSLGFPNVQGNFLYDFGTDVVTHPVFFIADLQITKVPSNPTPDFGETITYTITVDNVGTEPLTVTVADVDLGNGVLTSGVVLNPGDPALVLYAPATIDASFYPTFVNTAVATGTNGGAPVVVNATATITPSTTPNIELTKIASPNPATIGDSIDYSFQITNLSPVPITNALIVDSMLAGFPVNITFPPIAPGDSSIVLSSVGAFTIVETDLPGPITNTASAASNTSIGIATDVATETLVLTYTKGITITKTPDRTSINGAGQVVNYDFTIQNTGTVTLYNVAVVDDLTGYSTVVASLAPGAVTNLGPAVYTSTTSDLSAGGITNTVVVTGETIVGTSDLATGSDTAFVEALPNLTLSKRALPPFAGGSSVQPGDQIVYYLEVENSGAAANNVVVVDPVSSALTIDASTGVVSGNTVTFTLSVPANTVLPATYVGTITATVNSVTTHTVIANTAELSHTSGTTTSNTVTHTIYAQPELEIVKSADPASGNVVQPGDTITYTLYVANTGFAPALNPAVQDVLPSEVTLEPTPPSNFFTNFGQQVFLNNNNPTLDYNLGAGTTQLAAGEAFTVYFRVTVDNVPGGTVFTNTADASYTAGTPTNPTNIITTTNPVTHVLALPDLEMTKTVQPGTLVETGSTLTYTVVVDNVGVGTATSVVITDVVPSGLAVVDATSSSGTLDRNSNSITVTQPSLVGSSQITVTIVATVTETVSGTQIANTGYVVSAEDAASDTVTVTVTSATTPTGQIFLPIIYKVGYPDLVVTNIDVASNGVELTIQNIGSVPATPTQGAFWVDFYYNLLGTPTEVNDTWNAPASFGGPYSSQGVGWLVPITLGPGGTLTLECISANPGTDVCTGPYVALKDQQNRTTTNFKGDTSGGTATLAGHVDSASTELQGTGSVVEGHEILGGSYNNILIGGSYVPGPLDISSEIGTTSVDGTPSPVRP